MLPILLGHQRLLDAGPTSVSTMHTELRTSGAYLSGGRGTGKGLARLRSVARTGLSGSRRPWFTHIVSTRPVLGSRPIALTDDQPRHVVAFLALGVVAAVRMWL